MHLHQPQGSSAQHSFSYGLSKQKRKKNKIVIFWRSEFCNAELQVFDSLPIRLWVINSAASIHEGGKKDHKI